jgi:hypothetical protein
MIVATPKQSPGVFTASIIVKCGIDVLLACVAPAFRLFDSE